MLCLAWLCTCSPSSLIVAGLELAIELAAYAVTECAVETARKRIDEPVRCTVPFVPGTDRSELPLTTERFVGCIGCALHGGRGGGGLFSSQQRLESHDDFFNALLARPKLLESTTMSFSSEFAESNATR